MADRIEFRGIPKGKEKHRLYHTPKLKHVQIDYDSPFTKELNRLLDGEIDEMDLEKVKREFKEYKKSTK